MADTKISGLPSAGALTGAELVAVVDAGVTSQTTATAIAGLATSQDLGTADLTSTANERTFTLNGSLVTNLFTIDNGAGTAIAKFKGNSAIDLNANTVFDSGGTNTSHTVKGTATSQMIMTVGAKTSYFQQNLAGSNNAYFAGAINWKLGASLAIQFNTAGILMYDGFNIDAGATTGTKIGTATTRKLGFWGATPLVQPTALTAADATATDGTIGTNDTITNNLRVRLDEMEARFSTAGGGIGLIA